MTSVATNSNRPAARAARPRLPLVVLCLGGLLVTGWLLTHRPTALVAPTASLAPEATAAGPEVERSFLVLQDGRLCLDSRPFTGSMVEFYPDGSTKSRSAIAQGKLQGVSEGWFTNQVQQVREEFVAGISHGQRIRWDSEGRKVSEATIANGLIQGVFRRWHANGILAEEAEMKDGQPDGATRAWFPSGFLKAEARVVRGKAEEVHRYADGERREPPTSLAKAGTP